MTSLKTICTELGVPLTPAIIYSPMLAAGLYQSVSFYLVDIVSQRFDSLAAPGGP